MSTLSCITTHSSYEPTCLPCRRAYAIAKNGKRRTANPSKICNECDRYVPKFGHDCLEAGMNRKRGI
jgi:hypothetical protein